MLTPKGRIPRIDPKTDQGSTKDLVLGTPELSHLEIKTITNGGSDPPPLIIKDNSHNTETLVRGKNWKFNKELKNKPTKTWWNQKCKKITLRNKAFNKWRKNPNERNRIEYKTLNYGKRYNWARMRNGQISAFPLISTHQLEKSVILSRNLQVKIKSIITH